MNVRRYRCLSVVVLCIFATSCSSSKQIGTAPTSAPTTAAPVVTAAPTTTVQETTTTTINPASLFDAYVKPGPYPVGITTLTLPGDIKVEVWYPAVEGTTGTETYDVRDFTPPAIKALLTADIPATYSYKAGRDAAVADGKFPVVLNSHGFSGIRVGSSFLTSHLASWGMIVVSPDHPSRDLYHAVGTPAAVPTDSKDDLLASLDLITAQGTTPGTRFEGHVDPDRVAALGHSAGGGTVLAAAQDDRVDGYVSMASGAISRDQQQVEMPNKPSFFLSGKADQVVPEATTRDAFTRAPSPSLLWVIEGVGHNGFDDFCTFGDGKGIIGIAEASGLGSFLDAQPQFRKLGQDGCLPPAAPVETTFPMIDHAITGWLLNLFGLCEVPPSIGPEVASLYPQPVVIEQH